MYKKIALPLKGDDDYVPIFHIIISWCQVPGPKIDFANVRAGGTHICYEDMATLAETESPLTEKTKPFVSIVRIVVPFSSEEASLPGSVAVEDESKHDVVQS